MRARLRTSSGRRGDHELRDRAGEGVAEQVGRRTRFEERDQVVVEEVVVVRGAVGGARPGGLVLPGQVVALHVVPRLGEQRQHEDEVLLGARHAGHQHDSRVGGIAERDDRELAARRREPRRDRAGGGNRPVDVADRVVARDGLGEGLAVAGLASGITLEGRHAFHPSESATPSKQPARRAIMPG